MFQNRTEAGELLARKLIDFKDSKEAIVLAIPRGGVVVGRAISRKLKLPLDVVVVKKLGAPGNPELAIGAVATDGIKVIDAELSLRLGVEQEYLDNEVRKKIREIEEREKKYKPTTYHLQPITILTDDGIATGSTVEVAIKYIRKQKTKIILAVPVIAKDTYERLKSQVDELIALEIPEYFGAVGQFYREFGQVTDEQVVSLLEVRGQNANFKLQ